MPSRPPRHPSQPMTRTPGSGVMPRSKVAVASQAWACQRHDRGIGEVNLFVMREPSECLRYGVEALPGQRGVSEQRLKGLHQRRAGHGVAAAQHPGQFGQHEIADEQRARCLGMGIETPPGRCSLPSVVDDQQPHQQLGVQRDHGRRTRRGAGRLARASRAATCSATAAFISSMLTGLRAASCSRPYSGAAPRRFGHARRLPSASAWNRSWVPGSMPN